MEVHTTTSPEEIKLKMVVFGASEKTGLELTRRALIQGHIVTAYVRRRESLTFSHPNLRIIQGELHDYLLLHEVIKNQDAVLSALGASSPFRFEPDLVDGFGNILKAMETSRVRRLIYMSFAGVKESRSKAGLIIRYIAPLILKTEIRGHELRERKIVLSFSEWTIVRPVTLTNKQTTRAFRTGEEIRATAFPVTISRAAVADFMLQQLTDNRFRKKKPLVMI